MLSSWGIPPIHDLFSNLKKVVRVEDAAARSLRAMRDGVFVHPDGRRDDLNQIMNPLRQIALLCWLAQQCKSKLTVEIGFGMGSTASFMMSARRAAGHDFEHVVLDRWGLADGAGMVTQEYLSQEFESRFDRRYQLSTVGLAVLLEERGEQSTDMILLDGDHRFDGVLADFHTAARLLSVGGFMILDDAAYPGVETLVRFIESNRMDFEVSWLEINNTAVLKKVSCDSREWSHFVPFGVSNRLDWVAHPTEKGTQSEDWELLTP